MVLIWLNPVIHRLRQCQHVELPGFVWLNAEHRWVDEEAETTHA